MYRLKYELELPINYSFKIEDLNLDSSPSQSISISDEQDLYIFAEGNKLFIEKFKNSILLKSQNSFNLEISVIDSEITGEPETQFKLTFN